MRTYLLLMLLLVGCGAGTETEPMRTTSSLGDFDPVAIGCSLSGRIPCGNFCIPPEGICCDPRGGWYYDGPANADPHIEGPDGGLLTCIPVKDGGP